MNHNSYFSTPFRLKDQPQLASVQLNHQQQINNQSHYKIKMEHNYASPCNKLSEDNVSDKQNQKLSPNKIFFQNKLENSPTIRLKSMIYSPISEQQHQNDSTLEEISSRLRDNVQIIDQVNKSRLERSKSRRRDQLFHENSQRSQSFDKKKNILSKINMKLKSIKETNLNQNIKIQDTNKILEQHENRPYNDESIEQVNKSLKRSLKDDFLQSQIPIVQSILKLELSHCQNKLHRLKSHFQEPNEDTDYHQQTNRQKSLKFQSEIFNIQNSTTLKNDKKIQNNRKIRNHSLLQKNYKIQYERYGQYIYPKYINPVNNNAGRNQNLVKTKNKYFKQINWAYIKQWSPCKFNHKQSVNNPHNNWISYSPRGYIKI